MGRGLVAVAAGCGLGGGGSLWRWLPPGWACMHVARQGQGAHVRVALGRARVDSVEPPMHVRSRSAPHTLSAREGRLTLHLHALESSSCTLGLIKEGEMLMATQRDDETGTDIYLYTIRIAHI
jgi:hypothetical protein